MKRIRWDFFVCFLAGTLLMVGVITLLQKANLVEGIFSVFDAQRDAQEVTVKDGEVGGIALEDTQRISSLEDLAAVQGTFTMEILNSLYISAYSYEGDEYEWKLLKFNDYVYVPARINADAIQESGEGYNAQYILPVGTLVMEAAEDVLDKIPEDVRSAVAPNFYIDMDGEANATKATGVGDALHIVGTLLLGVAGLLLFAVYIGIILGLHKIGVKAGIFPAVKIGKINL